TTSEQEKSFRAIPAASSQADIVQSSVMLVLPRAAYRLNSHEANTADDRSHLDKRQRARALVVSAEVAHAPMVCAACGAVLGPDLKRRCVSAHDSLELVRGDMALQVTATRHSYFAVRCPCGHDNVQRPRVGLSSLIEGRKR